MIKRFLSTIAVMALGIGAAAAAGSPALAAGPCYADSICFYNYSTDTNPFWNCDDADCGAYECRAVPSPNTSYIKNTSKYRFYVYRTSNCGYDAGTIYPKSQGAMTGVWNNSIRSVMRSNSQS